MEPAVGHERLVRIETTLMHLDHDVRQMHEAILAQQRELDSLRRTVERFEVALERQGQPGIEPEVRDPAAEKPPHY